MKQFAMLILGVVAAAGAVTAGAAGDPEAGKQAASTCSACHGMDGNSSMAQWPKLAGQHEQYLARQTKLVRDGKRQVAQMMGIVAGLSDTTIDNIAAYYANQTTKPGVADPELVPLGKRIYQSGNAASGTPSCMGCHGPAGKGNPMAQYPKLAGQHAQYTASRLKSYRDQGAVFEDDPYSAQMAVVADNLTDREIEAVASYIQGLHSAQTADRN